MNVTETQTQTAFEPLRCHSLIVPWTFFFSLTGKNKTNIKTVPMYRPTTSFWKTTKKKNKNKRKNSQTQQGRTIRSSHSASYYLFLHSTLCQQLIGCFANRDNKRKKKKAESFHQRWRLAAPSLRHTMAASYCIKSMWMVELLGSHGRKQERTASSSSSSSWPQ